MEVYEPYVVCYKQKEKKCFTEKTAKNWASLRHWSKRQNYSSLEQIQQPKEIVLF